MSIYSICMGFPGGAVVKNLPANAGDTRDGDYIPGSRRSRGGGNGKPLQYSWPGKFHGQSNLAGYSPWGCKESAVTACTHTHSHRENMEGCSIPEGTRRTPRARQRTAGATCSRQGEPTGGLEKN